MLSTRIGFYWIDDNRCFLDKMDINKDEASSVYVTLAGMEVDIMDKIPKVSLDEDFKDSLLANLYSTVEFMKKELEEKNIVIKALLSLQSKNVCLCAESQSEFLTRSEIVETSRNNTLSDISSKALQSTLRNSDGNDLNRTISKKYFDSNNKIESNNILNQDQLICESPKELINDKLSHQLHELRKHKHSDYVQLINKDVIADEICERNVDNNHK